MQRNVDKKVKLIMKDLWITVPSYWTNADTEETPKNATVFDHPTPLNGESTMPRMLDSFLNLKGNFKVLIIAAGTHQEIAQDIHNHVSKLLEPYKNKLEIYLISPLNLNVLNSHLDEAILKLDTYGNIRNVQLCLPFAAGADAVVGIDDDEIIEDVDYLSKVEPYLGTSVNNQAVDGMAGIYYDSNGEFEISGADELKDDKNIFLKKNYFMNEALKGVMADKRFNLVKSNVAFGGNMIMPRDTIATSCHDPFISRGEDYDYVINAAMDNKIFFFNKTIGITHLPPDSDGSQAADKHSKLVADVKRFIYMQIKWQYYLKNFPENPIDSDYVFPYPGPYLQSNVNLEEEALKALTEKYPNKIKDFPPKEIVDNAVSSATSKVVEFFKYKIKWQEVLSKIDSKATGKELAEKFLLA